MGKYSALWTGDNLSNYHYLRNSIAVSLNLALSGVPFNGPDIGGFARSTQPQLLRDWMKACFLFPFCRNHTEHASCDQEPWAFDAPTREVMKHYIQLRYKMRPYLYNLFVQQELTGEAIIRPLFYDFEDTEEQPLGYIDDQLMIGPSILHAPVLSEHERTRSVVLPQATSWFSPLHGGWQPGGQTITVAPKDRQTPVFIREGAILPMTPGAALPTDNRYDGNTIHFHVFLQNGSELAPSYEYVSDDGESYGYQKGKRSSLKLTAHVEADGTLAISAEQTQKGFGDIRFAVVTYDRFPRVTINGERARKKAHRWEFAGSKLSGLARWEGSPS